MVVIFDAKVELGVSREKYGGSSGDLTREITSATINVIFSSLPTQDYLALPACYELVAPDLFGVHSSDPHSHTLQKDQGEMRLSSKVLHRLSIFGNSSHSFSVQQRRLLANHAGTELKLNTGQRIPAVGFGTWQDKDAQEDAVYEALLAGYRHIDTARIYGTEPAVSRGIKRSGVPRDDIFLVTKLWNNSHLPQDVESACDASLKDLNVDHVDLYLMHWPSAFKSGDKLRPTHGGKILTDNIDFVETWKAMESLVQKGKTKAIGISNFSKAEVERLLKETSIVPAAHQLECHPWLAQHSFTDWHKSKGIHVTQYSPLGNQNPVYKKGQEMSKLIDDPVLTEIGKKYGKSGAQTALAWGIAKGRSVIPKSKTLSRVKANLQSDFRLDVEDVEAIDRLDKKLRFNDPSDSFGYQYYTDLDGKE